MFVRFIIVLATIFLLNGCITDNTKEPNRPTKGIGAISVFPEVDSVAKVSVVEGKITQIDKVVDNPDGQHSIVFALSKMGGNGMMLSAKNSLSVIVKYDIEMVDYRGKKYYTSSCPLMPGMSVFESWGHTIPELII